MKTGEIWIYNMLLKNTIIKMIIYAKILMKIKMRVYWILILWISLSVMSRLIVY